MDTLNLDKIKNLLNLVICSLISSCNLFPSSPTDGNDDSIFEDDCYVSDTTILPSWQIFSDSMRKKGYVDLKIYYQHEYANPSSRCSKYHHFNNDHFNIDINNLSPNYNNTISKDSLERLQIQIAKELFTNYFSDRTIMENMYYVFRFGSTGDVLYRKEILDSCDFKIISIGKNKWKRITI